MKITASIGQLKDGAIVISIIGSPLSGVSRDLLFAEGFTVGDPRLSDQMAIAARIVEALNREEGKE